MANVKISGLPTASTPLTGAELVPVVQSGVTSQTTVDALALDPLATSAGSSLIGFLQSGTGAVATTVQAKLRETLSVKDFGAVGDGVTDDTAAIQAACNALTNGQILQFEQGKTYLISYIWSPYTDTSANLVGRGRAVCYIHNKQNITLQGNNCTIKCVDHNITTNGGFLFCLGEGSPGITVDGFNFDMSFIGYNNSSSYYPDCGGISTFDVPNQLSSNQSNICSNFTAKNLTFKLFHPLGSFAVTTHPYSGDYNNGYKVFAVACFGDTVTTDYTKMHRNFTAENITYFQGHNCYGTWAYAYNNAVFKHISAEAWVACYYDIATATRIPAAFVAPVRFQQFQALGLVIDNIFVRSLPYAERTGSFTGYCGGISLYAISEDRHDGGVSITNCTFILDNSSNAIGPINSNDYGIFCSLGGNITISNNSFMAFNGSGAGVTCIELLGYSNTGMAANYTITNNVTDWSISGPFVAIYNHNSDGDNYRGIKSVVVDGNIINGWGSVGSIYLYNAATYYGVENLIVSNNVFNGVNTTNTTTGIIIYAPARTANDKRNVTNNVLKNGICGYTLSSANYVSTDNIMSGMSVAGSSINCLTKYTYTNTVYSAGQTWTVFVPFGYYADYYYIEYSGGGNIVSISSYGSASSTITGTVGVGNTGFLQYKLIGNNGTFKSSTVTITIATPGVITWTSHGLSNNQAVSFTTTGALPTGIVVGDIYYVTGATTNNFQISATIGGAAIATSGSQSGVHYCATVP